MVVAISKAGLGTGATFLSNVTWETLEKLDADLADIGARLTYLDGCLEIIGSFSDAHEEPKNTLGQVLEMYMRTKDIRFYGRGSTTIGMKELGARKEPDESYCLGTRKSVPDLAIEVTVTSGGIDTLEIYRRVGVQEVWFWEDGVISVYCLRSTGYELVSKSELLPELDLRSIEFYSRMADQYDAVNAFVRSMI
ncbi:MAG: Uma2 family endonuclease [Microcoleus sp. PH2017_29_MFU_D_A]|uniref:Uma2 family endonuclease n=1 Tax=unclassified Microcoleus TaxID=2642155 RepID=UPI001D2E11C4|nr:MULTISPECIES: Uma2 family endonuclease [unclassified Microcoleus]MCC3422277.1 Uma2 family endonuclease [Microcoleus sp. PH2017_07_MST_O_A]TAE46135.1 MAG: Uma2 family endonuclease [Oscillatoriales cyanobacterium]MCC3416266.1 Uma2 family endonuclease [Microcoleus sp. PH2017_02_FOX_O_A]MCC3434208.1 Uma2 family endonuclease [Microcoleus sp. PH2017_05_CCC_O_A]MCC3451831.1 Uma2 family endonuclease [Microcoleus sp. PH2017_09_SFU_O_A]